MNGIKNISPNILEKVIDLQEKSQIINSQATKSNPKETPYLKRKHPPSSDGSGGVQMSHKERIQKLRENLLAPQARYGEGAEELKKMEEERVDMDDKFKRKIGFATI